MSHLDTLLQARLAGRRQQGSFWSSSGRGILVIAALNIVLLWSVTSGVIWQSYRDAADDWKRTAANFTLTTAAYAQQTLVATDLMLRSMLDWVDDEDITSETQFTDVVKQRRFHETIRDRLSGLPQVSVASIFNKEGHLLSSSTGWPAPSIYIGERETFLAQVGPNSPPISISRALPDLNTKRWNFYLSRRIKSKTDQLLGVAVVGIESDYFSNLFRLISLGEDSSVSLFRLDGALLATTLNMPDLLGKTYTDAQPIRMIRQGLSGSAQITHDPKWWQPSQSERRIVSARRVEGFPVLVSVTIGDKTFLGQWRERLYFILTLATLLSAVAVLVTAQILRPARGGPNLARVPGLAVDVVPDDVGERFVVDASAIGEAEPLHHRLRGEVVGQRDGEDQIELQRREAIGERCARHFRGIAVAPDVGMQRPQDLGLVELGHEIQAAMADQPVAEKDTPRRVPPLLPRGGEATDRAAHRFDRLAHHGRQPLGHLGMAAHGGVGFGVAGHQGPQAKPFGPERGHLYRTLHRREGGETVVTHITVTGNPNPRPRRVTWQTTSSSPAPGARASPR